MLCLAQDVLDTIKAGDPRAALDQVSDLMDSVHRPTKSWQDEVVTEVYDRAISDQNPDLTLLLRVIARTSDQKARETRLHWVYERCEEKILEVMRVCP